MADKTFNILTTETLNTSWWVIRASYLQSTADTYSFSFAISHVASCWNWFTLLSCMKKIVQSCEYVGLSGLALQRNSSNCLVLIPHKQVGNFIVILQWTCTVVIVQAMERPKEVNLQFAVKCHKWGFICCRSMNTEDDQCFIKESEMPAQLGPLCDDLLSVHENMVLLTVMPYGNKKKMYYTSRSII